MNLLDKDVISETLENRASILDIRKNIVKIYLKNIVSKLKSLIRKISNLKNIKLGWKAH